MIVHTASRETVDTVVAKISHVVIGQLPLIQKLFIAPLADGHVLLEGAPGLAKTQLLSALGKATGGCFRRIQLLPDLMPSDVTGTLINHPEKRQFRVQKGPILDMRAEREGVQPDEIIRLILDKVEIP